MELHITLYQLLFTILTVLALFFAKYNKLSDQFEVNENHIYSIKLFWKNNWMNLIGYIISGTVLLGVLNEIGIEFILKNIANVNLEGIEEKAADLTVAVIAGLFGHTVIKKFL